MVHPPLWGVIRLQRPLKLGKICEVTTLYDQIFLEGMLRHNSCSLLIVPQKKKGYIYYNTRHLNKQTMGMAMIVHEVNVRI